MIFSTPTAALRAYYFIAFSAIGLYLPFFPIWLRTQGFVGEEMSALVALLPICQLFSPALVGILADGWGLRGRLMIVCAAATALGLSCLAILAYWLNPLPFLFAWLCVLAFALLRPPTVGLADALAMEIAPDYGRIRLWGSLGFMSSALLGGQLINPKHAFALPTCIAVTLWALVLVSWTLPKTSHLPPRPALRDARQLLAQSTYRHLLLTMMLIFGGLSAYDLCASLRLDDLGANGLAMGAFWAIATSSEVLLMYFAAPFLKRVGPGKLLTLACAISTGRWLFLSQVSSLSLILAFQPLHAFSFGLMWISSMGVLRREVGERGAATAQGLFGSATAIGATLGLSCWGIVYEQQNSQTVFLCAAGVSALATIQAARLIRLSPAHHPEPALASSAALDSQKNRHPKE